MTEELCHCGRPLHYSKPELREMVERLIAATGATHIVVHAGGRRWRVQRHYIALHGLKAWEIPNLGFEEVFDG
jgi:hypothetical protein